MRRLIPGAAVLLLGLVLGLILHDVTQTAPLRAEQTAAAQTAAAQPTTPPMTIDARVERLEQKAVDQAHAMTSVAYHFDNLWFAGQRGNWPLAQFYFGETRSHLRWAVRIIPVRKDNQGKEVKLADILQSLENTPLKQLEESIKAQDREKFGAAYQFTLTGCYACHKASDKPYLQLKVPDHPSESMIEFSPLPEPFATTPQSQPSDEKKKSQ